MGRPDDHALEDSISHRSDADTHGDVGRVARHLRNDSQRSHGSRSTSAAEGGWANGNAHSEYKLKPIARELRRIIGAGRRDHIPAGTFQMWIGISTDEASRMKDARQRYIVNRWPLVERNMSRTDCVAWLKAHGFQEPPKSACIGCPFHDGEFWRTMKRERPNEFADAVQIDAALRTGHSRGMRAQEFMHRARVPLMEAVTEAPKADDPNLFAAMECEGMCGV